MPSLKDVQNKIAAVKKDQADYQGHEHGGRLQTAGCSNQHGEFRPYAGKFAEVLGSLAEKAGEEASPLLVPREEVKNIHMVLCTSDRGFCGGFNVNLIDKGRGI